MELTLGLKGNSQTVVNQKNTAKEMGSGSLHVFSTPSLCALMENAACNALDHILTNDHTTVGTMIQINHTSATPVGMSVYAEADLISINGRKLTFEITAHDDKELIATAIHERVLINTERFLQKVNNKL